MKSAKSFLKYLSVVLVLAIIALSFAGCAGQSKPNETDAGETQGDANTAQSSPDETQTAESESAEITAKSAEDEGNEQTKEILEDLLKDIKITDMAGHEIKISSEINRIVVLTAADCEIVCALGAKDLIVGRGEYCDYPKDVLEITSLQSGESTNIEQILSLNPDLVLMSAMNQTEEQVAAIESAGIPVVLSDAHDLSGVYESINVIGAVLGKEKQAEELISDMQGRFESIQSKIAQLETDKKRVYFEISPLEYGLWTAGNDTFMAEIAEILKTENIFSDLSGWCEVSQEQVLERNPDYIFTMTMYSGEGPKPDEEIKSRKGWDNVKAVSEGKVFNADSDELTRPGPRLIDAAESLFSIIYE